MLKNFADIKQHMTNISHLRDSFLNDGVVFDYENNVPKYNEEGEVMKVSLKDFVTVDDLRPLMKTVISTILVDTIQPALLIIPNLATVIRTNGSNEVIQIKAIEDVEVGYVGKGGDYPETHLAFDNIGDAVASRTRKVGAKLIVDQEVVKADQYGIIAVWLSAAGKALARFKETEALRVIQTYGTTVFDNADPQKSEFGTTSGLSAQLTRNGTFTVEDLHRMYAYLWQRGFKGDTMIIHPLAWQVLAMDPLMGQNILKGNVLAYPQIPTGTRAKGFADPFKGKGAVMTGTGTKEGSSAWVNTITPVGNFYEVSVNYAPTPVKVLVSHYVPYQEIDVTEGTGASAVTVKKFITDIIMADSSKGLILYQSEDPNTKEGFIDMNETYWLRVQEKYGFGVWAQGKGLIVAKNVVVDKNYNFTTVNQQSIQPINPAAPIVTL